MVERLLLDRIDAEAGRAAVGRQHDRVALALADEARAALALVQAAVARAEVALDAAVVEAVPPAAGMVLMRETPPPRARSFRPLGHGIACQPGTRCEPRSPPARPALRFSAATKAAWLGQRLPHLRQERRAPLAVLEDDAVDAGPQLPEQVFLVVEDDRLVGGEQRHLDRGPAELVDDERRKARIAERGGDGVFADVGAKRATRLERSDAPAQARRPAAASRTWRRAHRARGAGSPVLPGEPELRADRIARNRQQRPSEVTIRAWEPPSANANAA